MQSDLQIWQLIWQASLMVKGVMAILFVASMASWMIIFRKRQILSKSEKDADTFEERFWSGTDLSALQQPELDTITTRFQTVPVTNHLSQLTIR